MSQLQGSSVEKALKGGYVVLDTPNAAISLVSTGSEVGLCLQAAASLERQNLPHQQFGINRVGASGPCDEVFQMLERTPEGVTSLACICAHCLIHEMAICINGRY
ncbi:hypothetical protein NUU61_002686 [Penicillium alfredii]|uniref:Uncharacterized protein n=1 Tax=Penicillium alfredii TaxID=1506179 RepID=A0A9W9FS10_9EURO|nr:uncharacterized protein NUU61_002686 [Penicillium alfredii]KAJ5105339.1 hypothetical protein NUU61_002686 [Penicillium alfredii]